MGQEVSNIPSLQGGFWAKVKQGWGTWLIILITAIVLIFLLYPRSYSYVLEDTCENKSEVVSARCIGMRWELFDLQEMTLRGELCSIDKQGQKCIGISILEKLN